MSLPAFFSELEGLEKHGIKAEDRLLVSDRAHVLFELHRLLDGLEEAELGKELVGTTKKGIGPCYQTKHGRSGLRIGDIFNKETMDRKLRIMADSSKKRFGDLLKYDVEAEIRQFDTYRERLAPYVVDQVPLIQNAEETGIPILVEGANALLLDVDWGTYPMVTSSNTGIGGVFTGLGINPFKIKHIIGVVKAYQTRVGSGPFPTEQLNPDGEKLQTVGKEFGVTTGRKRRCGWLDLVIMKYSNAINHYTALNLTKLDILDDFEEIKVAVEYKVDGKPLLSFPASFDTLSQVEVVYKIFPGWKSPTTGAKTFEEMPANAQKYVEFVENFVGVHVKWIGTGKDKANMIVR